MADPFTANSNNFRYVPDDEWEKNRDEYVYDYRASDGSS
jgi:hypothetical protein